MAEVAGSTRPISSFFLKSATLEPSNGAFSDTRIMVQKKHNKDKKLHNFDEKLHNSHELDLSWQETVDLLPEDYVEGGSEIYYFTDEDGNVHSREFLAEELIDDAIKEKEESRERKSREEKVQRLKSGTTDILRRTWALDPINAFGDQNRTENEQQNEHNRRIVLYEPAL